MPLYILAAKTIEEAYERSLHQKRKEAYIIEEKGVQDFLFQYRDQLKQYDIYWQLNPYGVSKVECSDIPYIQVFAKSVKEWTEHHPNMENRIIDEFNLSFPRINRYMERLIRLCGFALENKEGFIALGD